ncbi:MAG: hypothetical protein AAGF12_19655 [Myxococcota bacterium]
MIRRLVILHVLVVLLAWAPMTASAYQDPLRFGSDTLEGGAGGRQFTGSPADGFTCAVCHGAAPGGLELLDPIEPFAPDQSQTIGFFWPTAQNSAAVAVEITDEAGNPVGTLDFPPNPVPEELCPGGFPATTLSTVGGRPVAYSLPCGNELMRIVWTPPPEGGSAWLFASAVLPNGDGTPVGDAVATISRPLSEAGAPPVERSVANGACSAGGELPGSGAIFALVLWVLGRRRVRDRRPSRRRDSKPGESLSPPPGRPQAQ